LSLTILCKTKDGKLMVGCQVRVISMWPAILLMIGWECARVHACVHVLRKIGLQI
jgi:hypothetical protein